MFQIAYQYLNPPQDRANTLFKHVKQGDEIAEPVQEISLLPGERILVFLCLRNREIVSHICWGRKGNRAGTKLTRLNFDRLEEISPINVRELSDRPEWYEFADFFGGRDVFRSAANSEYFFSLMRKTFSDVDEYIERSIADYSLIDNLTPNELAIVRQEHDATEMALRIANMVPRRAYQWSPSGQGKKAITSFFTGLKPASLLEDDVVRWELHKIPGFKVIDDSIFGHYVLGDGDTVLHTFHANKNALEKTMGVDLIYFNEEHENFVLVQYKMAEPQAGTHVFRFPNAQLSLEVGRMDVVLKVLQDEATKAGFTPGASDFRITENPFFLKFCPRDGFDPDANEQVRGMIIPLELWKIIEADTSGLFVGPSGGNILSFENCPRYLDNTRFISLLQEGWIGTSAISRVFLEEVITELINNGRSVILAAKLAVHRPVAPPAPVKKKRRKKRASAPKRGSTKKAA